MQSLCSVVSCMITVVDVNDIPISKLNLIPTITPRIVTRKVNPYTQPSNINKATKQHNTNKKRKRNETKRNERIG